MCLRGLQDHQFPTLPSEQRRFSLPAIFMTPLYPHGHAHYTDGTKSLQKCIELFSREKRTERFDPITVNVKVLDLDMPNNAKVVCYKDRMNITTFNISEVERTTYLETQDECSLVSQIGRFRLSFQYKPDPSLMTEQQQNFRGGLFFIYGKFPMAILVVNFENIKTCFLAVTGDKTFFFSYRQ